MQRCQQHKRRNVLGHLPKALHASVGKVLTDAYKSPSKKAAKARLLALSKQLLDDHPDAAASLKEGLDETLTVVALNLSPLLQRTLATTNAIENLNGSIRRIARRVKRWRDGRMVKRWIAAGIIEAERGFHRIRGHKSLAKLVQALKDNADAIDELDRKEQAA